MIHSAKRAENTREITTRLQRQQLQGWLSSGKSADDVSSCSRLVTTLLTLFKFLEGITRTRHYENAKFFQTLRNGLGSDNKFAIVVSKAMEISSGYAKAVKLQTKLFEK
ncbi:RxLR effector protein [Phytophthora megakarya]|uniref:RxLR effector protein n=1 Tax=Phytophthora megakarya TaxID=4795 RepID=A0A225WXR2_9STRA|nr:RxLR effector protein [Phytophthora megakarya]